MKKSDDVSRGTRGAVIPVPKGKTRITIRIDDDVVEAIKFLLAGVHIARGYGTDKIFTDC
ncbi:MAG: hypothetical protein ACXW5U_31045 [Thermoanaerobaculia bacterium]